MSLSLTEINTLLERAKKATLLASQIIQTKKNEVPSIRTKGENHGSSIASQIITNVDLEAQSAIIDALQESITRFDLGLLTEEQSDDQSRFQKDYFWCIDPLDGTLAYSQGKEGYSVSVALVKKSGQPVIGVVADPVCNSLYWAVQGQGASKNGQSFHVKNFFQASRRLKIFVDSGLYSRSDFDARLQDFALEAQIQLEDIDLRVIDGAVMAVLKSLEESPAMYFKSPKIEPGGGCLWDFAASSIIFAEAGGMHSDYLGNPLNLNSSEIFLNNLGVIFDSRPSVSIRVKMETVRLHSRPCAPTELSFDCNNKRNPVKRGTHEPEL